MIGHIVSKVGIPEECPSCGANPIEVVVEDYDPVWHDGKVVCKDCGHFIRYYDAG